MGTSWRGVLRKFTGQESEATKAKRRGLLTQGITAVTPTPIQAALAEPRESQDTSFGNAQRYAEAAAGSDANLRAALKSRATESGDLLAERFNMGGQAPTAGVFQDALARDVGRQSFEASLARQQDIAGLTERMYGQGRGEAVGLGTTNAGATNDTSRFNADQSLRASLSNAGQRADVNRTIYGDQTDEAARWRENSPWATIKRRGSKAEDAVYNWAGGGEKT